MKPLTNLKERLVALPEFRKSLKQTGLFTRFHVLAEAANLDLSKASTTVSLASPSLPSREYDVAKKSIKSSARIAKNLAEKLRRDADAISDPRTEESFTNLSNHAKEALKRTKSGWQSSLQSKIEKWEVLSGVVCAIGQDTPVVRAQSDRLKTSVDRLRSYADKLPSKSGDVDLVVQNLEQLIEAVSQLGLDTPFGKFLQAAASEQGAAFSDSLVPIVAQQIEALNLRNSFRIRLSS
jgi:hypothetical protein